MSALGVNISNGDLIQQQHRGNWKIVTLIDGVVGAAGANLASEGEDVSLYTYKTLEIQTTADCLFTYQTSNDNVNWFDPMKYQVGDSSTAGDVTEYYDCNAEKRSIEITRTCRYIRVFVTCTAESTVTAKLTAQM